MQNLNLINFGKITLGGLIGVMYGMNINTHYRYALQQKISKPLREEYNSEHKSYSKMIYIMVFGFKNAIDYAFFVD